MSRRCIADREPVPWLVRKLVLLNPPVDSSRDPRRDTLEILDGGLGQHPEEDATIGLEENSVWHDEVEVRMQ